MLTLEQRRFRRRGIGGSDVAAICGLSPFKKPIDVFVEKTAEGDVADEEPTDAQRFGALLEPIVADEYQRRHADKTVIGPFDTCVHPSRPWHLFSLDRVVIPPGGRTLVDLPLTSPPPPELIDRVLEIKTAGLGTFRSFGDDGSDDLPEHVICQVVWYLSGVDVNNADVAALLNTSDYREFHVERDRELEAYLLEEAEAFWFKVQANEPPDPDGSESFSRYVKDRCKRTSGLVAKANPEVDAIAVRLRAARAARKAIDLEEARLTQRLQLAIGENDAIETEQGKVSFKHDKRGRIAYGDAFKSLADDVDMTPEQAAEYLEGFRGEPPRKFIVPRTWSKDPPLDLLSILDGKRP